MDLRSANPVSRLTGCVHVPFGITIACSGNGWMSTDPNRRMGPPGRPYWMLTTGGECASRVRRSKIWFRAYGRESTWATNDSTPLLCSRIVTKSSWSTMSDLLMPNPGLGYRGGRRKSCGVLSWKGNASPTGHESRGAEDIDARWGQEWYPMDGEACAASLAGIECRQCRWTDFGSSEGGTSEILACGGIGQAALDLPD